MVVLIHQSIVISKLLETVVNRLSLSTNLHYLVLAGIYFFPFSNVRRFFSSRCISQTWP